MAGLYAAIPALFLDQLALAAVVWFAVPVLGFKDDGNLDKPPLNDTAAKHVALFPFPVVRQLVGGWPGLLLAAIVMLAWIAMRLAVAAAIANS